MTEMTPETAPAPEPGSPGFIGHIIDRVRSWFERDVVPRVVAVEGDLERVVKFAEAHAANAKQLADIVVGLVKTADPAAAPAVAELLAEAEKAAAEAVRIAEEFLHKM
jgi:hypothetical protein